MIHFLLWFMTLEIVMGGGGRLFFSGTITPRYIIFALLFFSFLFDIIHKKNNIQHTAFSGFMAILLISILGVLVGALKGHSFIHIFFDLQPLLYLLAYLCLINLNEENKCFLVETFISMVKFFSIAVSVIYIIYCGLSHMNPSYIHVTYSYLGSISEIIFRPDGSFFYKGFLFLPIGAIFFLQENKYFCSIFILLTCMLSETRGLVIFGMLSILLILAINKKILLFAMFTMIFIGMLQYIYNPLCFSSINDPMVTASVNDRTLVSSRVRIQDLFFIFSHLEWRDFFWGKGFGSYIGERQRIEVVYLEIFYKTGFLGCLCCAYLFILGSRRLLKNNKMHKMFPILLYVFGVSMTNPFVFTPMGIFTLAIILISSEWLEVGSRKPMALAV